jgi:ABC-type sulfate/molybdate transport systems ATPase subunit
VELVALRRELGTPMIFVTHDQAGALSTADCIVVLSEGRVLPAGTPPERIDPARAVLFDNETARIALGCRANVAAGGVEARRQDCPVLPNTPRTKEMI